MQKKRREEEEVKKKLFNLMIKCFHCESIIFLHIHAGNESIKKKLSTASSTVCFLFHVESIKKKISVSPSSRSPHFIHN